MVGEAVIRKADKEIPAHAPERDWSMDLSPMPELEEQREELCPMCMGIFSNRWRPKRNCPLCRGTGRRQSALLELAMMFPEEG